MEPPLIVTFPGAERARRAEVGGKGASLIRMTEAGLPVPPGAVLTTAFFAPWFDDVKASAAWTALTKASREDWAPLCDELKERSLALSETPAQRDALRVVRQSLAGSGADVRFAVRSSSPEEDLASASFAGGYASRLGVRPDELEEAVRACFASSLDVRVFIYKQEHGFDVWAPRIAVVVQRQVDSEVAGVAFSINPATNDYDEAAIDASWGLGTSVVDGRVSPDHFVIDKPARRVVEATRGDKRVSVWLDPDGSGTVERARYRSAECTLSDAQLRELIDVLCRIEALYDAPVDVEWAYADGGLHVLQARPITAYVPLPPEMVTGPGQRRRLYSDIALSSGLTINAPISPMGLDWMRTSVGHLVEVFFGSAPSERPIRDALWFFAGNRMYQNLSNVMWLASPKKLAEASAESDALMAAILSTVDAARYRAPTRPPWAGWTMARHAPRLLWRLRRFAANLLFALTAPERARPTYQQRVEAFEQAFTESLDYDLPLDVFQRRYAPQVTRYLVDVTMPAIGAFFIALKWIDRAVGPTSAETKALAEKLKVGFTGNVVVEMGSALFRLSQRLEPGDVGDLARLAERVGRRQMPADFLSAWDRFLGLYGWRGPGEMDLANPRYADDPRIALQQMAFMATGEAGFDPEEAHARQVEERRRAYHELMNRLGRARRTFLRHIYRVLDLFAGTRDTPKHHNLLWYRAARTRVLMEGERLKDAGRLDRAEDVFDLRLEDLEAALEDPRLDLRQRREERTRFLKKLDAHVTAFPPVIDSRGRILRPPPTKDVPGLLRGMPVSPGVATGPVKVLRTPYEKPVEKGDVLVAYTTDPGWTPLFVNAAAIVLEVGGVLQHGAVVAREYGKPCVVGIDRVVARLRDGERVEVDGAAGTIRRLS